MAYVTYIEYKALYGETVTETDFNRLEYLAELKIDRITASVDHVRKLKVAFPTVEDDQKAVKVCVCEMINAMKAINEAREASAVKVVDGQAHATRIKSASSGSESVTYADGGTVYDSAASNPMMEEQLFQTIAETYLSGITDANGVFLLYGGVYPCIATQ